MKFEDTKSVNTSRHLKIEPHELHLRTERAIGFCLHKIKILVDPEGVRYVNNYKHISDISPELSKKYDNNIILEKQFDKHYIFNTSMK